MTVEIVFVPADKPGTYWPMFNGERLTKATKQPFFDAARALLKRGLLPDTSMISRHTGSNVIALQSTVGEAASWSVSEPDRGKAKRIPYVAYSPTTVDAPAAEEPAARVSERGEGRGASTGLQEPVMVTRIAVPQSNLPFDPAERGFVGAVYTATGPWTPTDPTIEAGDPA